MVDQNLTSVDQEVMQGHGLPFGQMERNHRFQDLSSLAPIMKEVLRRTDSLEGRFEKAERTRTMSPIARPNSTWEIGLRMKEWKFK